MDPAQQAAPKVMAAVIVAGNGFTAQVWGLDLAS
jgi:hypothetical protein